MKLLADIIAGKEIEMDIMVKLPDKTKINLEFYSSYSLPKEIKSSMYITKEYSGQLAKGEDYNLIKKVEQINFINGDTLRKDDKAIKTFCLIDKENLSNKMLEEYLELTIVNVASVKQKVYNKGNKNFELWRQFIGAKTKEEMEKIAKKREILKEVLEEMKRFSSNEPVQTEFTKERMHKSELNYARQEGLSEGINEGINRGKIEIAENMLARDMKISDISEITGLSNEELLSIQGTGVNN